MRVWQRSWYERVWNIGKVQRTREGFRFHRDESREWGHGLTHRKALRRGESGERARSCRIIPRRYLWSRKYRSLYHCRSWKLWSHGRWGPSSYCSYDEWSPLLVYFSWRNHRNETAWWTRRRRSDCTWDYGDSRSGSHGGKVITYKLIIYASQRPKENLGGRT